MESKWLVTWNCLGTCSRLRDTSPSLLGVGVTRRNGEALKKSWVLTPKSSRAESLEGPARLGLLGSIDQQKELKGHLLEVGAGKAGEVDSGSCVPPRGTL